VSYHEIYLSFYRDSEMPRNNQLSIVLSCVFFAVAISVLLFTQGLSYWLVLLTVVLIAINLCVECLTHWVPAKLRELSYANCLRLDGTCSSRRSSLERRALIKIRSDLWATFLIVAFFGAIGAYAVQSQFPLKLVPDVVSAAMDGSRDFKLGLKERGVDQQFFDWSESDANRSDEDARDRRKRLWMTWPVVLFLGVFAVAGGIALVRYAYFRTLEEFAAGVRTRSEEYLNLDIGRLHG
jgi:hypothetical protein